MKTQLPKKVIFLIAVLVCFLSLEAFVRIAYYVKYRDLKLLIAPFGNAPQSAGKEVDLEMESDYVKDENGKVLYYRYKPGTYTYETEYDALKHVIPYTISKNGFRGREIGPKDKYRIICFGASSTVGVESPEGQTWPAYLGSYTDTEVINMGVTGYDASNILNLLSMEAYKYIPDMVLLYTGRNDVHGNSGALALDTRWKKLFYKIHKLLHYRVMSYTYAIEKISLLKQGHSNPFLFYPYNPYPEFLENFNKILRFCEDKKIKLYYICQIKNYKGNAQHCIDLMKKISGDPQFMGYNKADVKETFIVNLFKLQLIVKEICEKYEYARFVDPRQEFYEAMSKDKNRDFFSENNTDSIHLTPLGNSVLAEIIKKKIGLRN